MQILTDLQLESVIGGVMGYTQQKQTMPANKTQKQPSQPSFGKEGGGDAIARPLQMIQTPPPPQPIQLQSVVGSQRLGGSMPTSENAQKA